MRRVAVNSVVRKSMLFSNVIVEITFPRRPLVFSWSCSEVSAGVSDVHCNPTRYTVAIYIT